MTDLEKACAFLDEHRDCVPTILSRFPMHGGFESQWCADARRHPGGPPWLPKDVVRRTLAETIIATARALGWTP